LSRHRFPKPAEIYHLLLLFGKNIVASEGEDWKRVRKVAAPAFSDVSNLFNMVEMLLLISAV
jgi:cytochrome P450